MAKPTHDDAKLVLELAQLFAAQGVGEAAGWIHSDAFIPEHAGFYAKYPPGSPEAVKLDNVLGWYETIGTLYKHGLINENLLFDWLAINVTWERVKNIIKGQQAAIDPALYENFEAMAVARARWAAQKRKQRRPAKK
jgi:hypothetical protein